MVVASFESDEETTDFVMCKIESLVANTVPDKPKDGKKSICPTYIPMTFINVGHWILLI